MGILVGVYGIAYYFGVERSRGLLVVDIGWLYWQGAGAYRFGVLNLAGQAGPIFFWVNVWNHVIWLLPFGRIIWQAIIKQLKLNR